MGSGISDIIGSIASVKNAAQGNWPGGDTQPTDINPAPTGTPGVIGVAPTGSDSGTDSGTDPAAKKKTQNPLVQGVGAGIANGLAAQDAAKARIAASGRNTAPITIPQGPGQIVQPNLNYLNPQQQYAPPSAFYGR